MITSGVLSNPFTEFDAITAAQVLAIIVLCGFVGIHPIIMISSFAPMILTLDPDPSLLAATFLFGWHLGTCSSPLSGTNLVFQGRYGIASLKIALWNWPYAIAMVIIGGNYLTRPLFRFIAVANLRELFTAAALMMVIGIALLMAMVGLSPALGTFLAGVVLANSEYNMNLKAISIRSRACCSGFFSSRSGQASISACCLPTWPMSSP